MHDATLSPEAASAHIPAGVYAETVTGVQHYTDRLFRFQRHLGTSPKRFIMETRLTRARNLLVQSDRSVTEVAVACGFRTSSTFAKVYRAQFGVSPIAQRSTLR